MTTIFGLTRSNSQVTATGDIESKTPGGLYINSVIPCAPHVDPARLNPLIPAPGVVTNGFQCCNGDARKPEFNIPGNLPKLDDDRLVSGHTSAGATGGAKTIGLTTDHLPGHSHAANHDAANAPHSHPSSTGTGNFPHGHNAANTGTGNMLHLHEQNVNVYNWTGGPNTGDWKTDAISGQFNQGTSTTSNSVPSHSHPNGPGPANMPHSHPGSANNVTDSHLHTFGATDSSGGADLLNIEPEAMTVIYLVRVR